MPDAFKGWPVVNAGGLVPVTSGAFSGASPLNVDGVFVTAHDDFLILADIVGSANAEFGFRVRAAGSDVSSGYSGVRIIAGSANLNQSDQLGTDEWAIGSLGTNARVGMQMTLFGPRLPQAVNMNSDVTGNGNAGFYKILGGGTETGTIRRDGFSLRPSTGTITGRWAVYGYAK